MSVRESPVFRPALWERLRLPLNLRRATARVIVDAFHRYYYRRGSWKKTSWLGIPTQQYPGDLVVLQQILWETRPDVVIETGTFRGGSALFFSSLFDLIWSGSVITIDVVHSNVDALAASHPRIRFVTGDSAAPQVIDEVRGLVRGKRVMLHLDADHREPAVTAELEAYADLVAPGCYIVVADSNINGHPLRVGYPSSVGGPYEAIQRFVQAHPEFEVDQSREYHLVTFHPCGYLRRRST